MAATTKREEAMVIAYHSIITARGFWLPNDGRGSWSQEVWAEHLKPSGGATTISTRKSVAHTSVDWEAQRAAKAAMLNPPVVFNGEQARAVARGFAIIVAQLVIIVYACAILPDHIHLVARRHRETNETLVGFIWRSATRQLGNEAIHPCPNVTPWARGGWKRFLNTSGEITNAVDYTEKNPIKQGFKCQDCSFTTSDV